MTENEKTELFDKWYDENYDEWAEGEEGIALREELEQAFKGGITELENKIADLNMKIDGLEEQNSYMFNEIALQEQQIEKMRCCENCQTVRDAEGNCYLEKDGKCINLSKWELKSNRSQAERKQLLKR